MTGVGVLIPGIRIAQLLSTVTGILLLPAAYLSAMSGFCMREPGMASVLTLGFIGEYGLCSYLHLDAIPMILVALAFIHTLAALELVEAKLKDARYYKMIYLVFKVLAWILATQVLIIAVIYYI